MKYVITALVTGVVVFLGATFYYKGFPRFISPSGVSVTSTEVASTPSATPAPTAYDDNSALISAIKAALVLKHGSPAAELNITVSKVDGNYAEGGASGSGGGGMWFAAKVDGSWKLVWDGNGQIDCTSISPYPDFPVTMISECWSTSSGKLIKR